MAKKNHEAALRETLRKVMDEFELNRNSAEELSEELQLVKKLFRERLAQVFAAEIDGDFNEAKINSKFAMVGKLRNVIEALKVEVNGMNERQSALHEKFWQFSEDFLNYYSSFNEKRDSFEQSFCASYESNRETCPEPVDMKVHGLRDNMKQLTGN